MNKLFSIIILLVIFQSCKENEIADAVILSGVSKNNITELHLKTNQKFKLHSQPVIDFNLKHSKKNFQDSLIINDGYYDLIVNDRTILLYLKSGDNLNLDINNSQINITGNGRNKNEYLQNRISLEKDLSSRNFRSYYSTLNENRFLKLADSIFNLRINLIRDSRLKNSKLRFIEESFAKLDRAHKLLNYPFTRLRFDENYIKSKKFPDTFDYIDINDDRLIDLPYYSTLMFLKTINEVEALDKQSFDSSIDYLRFIIDDGLKVSNRKLQEEIVYKTINWTIEETDSLDKLFKIYRKFTVDSINLNKITDKYLNLKGLTKGSVAPNFTIKNKNGESTSLKSLKGNVVYIDFWATWCEPCISEITPSKELQKKFTGKDIKFVNICIESEHNSWVKMVSNKNIQGINLLVSKENENILKEAYFIQGLPRYVIIDKEGKIFDLSAKRPSNPELELDLMKLL